MFYKDYDIKIMTLKYTDLGDYKNQILKLNNCINYAINNNAKIINLSSVGYLFNILEYNIIKHAMKKQIILVTAAGNDSMNLDRSPIYPCSYNLANVMRVGATDNNRRHYIKSNYGSRVDFLAPGVNIFSSIPRKYGSYYMPLSGTSMATPFVSAYFAIILYKNSP